jgi:hypothetical protein
LVQEFQPTPGLARVVEDAEDAFPESGIVVVSRTPRFSQFLTAHVAGADLYVGVGAVGNVLDQWSALWRRRNAFRNILFDDIHEAVSKLANERAPEGGLSAVANSTIDRVTEQVMRALRRRPGSTAADFSEQWLHTAFQRALSSAGFYDKAPGSATALVERRMLDRYVGDLSAVVAPITVPAPAKRARRLPPEARRPTIGNGESTPSRTPANLFWNTEFPDDAGILRNAPHVVAQGGEYPFETALEVGARSGAASSPVVAAAIRNRLVVFALTCRNGEIRLDESSQWARALESGKLRCGGSGTRPYRVTYRAGTAGTAAIALALLVKGGTVATQRIELVVSGQATSEISNPALAITGPPSGAPMYRSAITNASETRLRLVLDADNHLAKLSVNGNNLPGTGVPPKIESLAAAHARALIALEAVSEAQTTFPGDGFALADPDTVRLAFAKAGARLHELLFLSPMKDDADPTMRSFADEIARRGGSRGSPLLEISAPGYPVPWGLLYDRSANGGLDLSSAADVDPFGFWGRRFDIQRMVSHIPIGDPLRGVRRRVKPVVAEAAPGGRASAEFIKELRRMRPDPLLTVRPTSTSGRALLAWAGTDADVDLVYFFCHARPATTIDSSGGVGTVTDPLESVLGFGDTERAGEKVRLADLKSKWWKGRRTNPIVFLNACSSGHLDAVYGAPFVSFFVDLWEAQTFLGTDWAVPGIFADRFGRRVLRGLLEEGASVREAVRRAADESFASKDDFPLLYGIYGPTNVRFSEETA